MSNMELMSTGVRKASVVWPSHCEPQGTKPSVLSGSLCCSYEALWRHSPSVLSGEGKGLRGSCPSAVPAGEERACVQDAGTGGLTPKGFITQTAL